MTQKLFDEFIASADTLRIYSGKRLVFSSTKARLLPIMEYLDTLPPRDKDVVIMDKIMGNAAALLAVMADCGEVYSPLGSELGIQTLDTHRIKHHLSRIVPRIMKPDASDMCPMEKLSVGKTPQEFYLIMKSKISGGK